MKHINYLLIFCLLGTLSCKKVIDLYPESNINTGTYYSNYEEVRSALSGVYNGLQRPLFNEWQFTELRSDNSKQGSPGSTSSTNRDLSDLDMFTIATTHQASYTYWLNTYAVIRNANIILQKLGVVYDPASGTIKFNDISIPISDVDRRQLAGEAMLLRAMQYFNLVRLYGGVFLVHEPISPALAKTINRSTVADIYKLIEADLTTAAASMNTQKFSQINPADVGRANIWAAKGLLAKVYLTQNKKAEAITQLQDVIANSGYGMQTNYANVFSINNEMNSEILFAVRFKAGGFGLGSPFANNWAAQGSGSAIINGDGDGLNYPSSDLDTAFAVNDQRRNVTIATFGSGTGAKLYVKKFLSPVTIEGDAENDFPILRYADILLMLAEAQGFNSASIGLINQVRTRAGLPAYDPSTITTVAQFEQALADERRLEFAFENQRWFDLLRFNVTMSTITAEQVIKDHFADEFQTHYRLYTAPTPTLAQLWANVTRDHLLLPIPQREIDTNTQLVIPQNPGY